MGFVLLAPRTNHAANWAIGALLLVPQLVYEITIAAPTYVIVTERCMMTYLQIHNTAQDLLSLVDFRPFDPPLHRCLNIQVQRTC
jgi:hypothetical protein